MPTPPGKSPSCTLAGLGEFGLISRIAAGVPHGSGVITGIGDDAAVTSLSVGMKLLTSTDMLLEDVHFRRAWHDPHRLGRKSLAVSVSDIAAMGGIPRWALLSLAIPSDLPLDFIDEFMRGFLALASEQDVALVGGDTCSSRGGLAISITIMGEQSPDLIIRRSGAEPGDDIWVTGTLGDAAMGLKILESGSDPVQVLKGARQFGCSPTGAEGSDFFISRLLDPTPRTAAGRILAESGLVTAMIDISDGILADFGHIAEQSGSGGCIRVADLPLSVHFRQMASLLGVDAHSLPLTGGEDYELCFTAPSRNREKISDGMKKCGVAAVPVGIVTRSAGVSAVASDGTPCSTQSEGFNHFTYSA